MSSDPTTAEFKPNTELGLECLDPINSLLYLGVSEKDIQKAALSYWTGAEPISFQGD